LTCRHAEGVVNKKFPLITITIMKNLVTVEVRFGVICGFMRVFHVVPEVEMSGLLPVYPSALPHGISNGFLSMPNLLADGAAISTSVNISTSGTETFRSGIYFRVYGGTSAFPYV